MLRHAGMKKVLGDSIPILVRWKGEFAFIQQKAALRRFLLDELPSSDTG